MVKTAWGLRMNYLWAGMIIIGVVYSIFTGNVESITDAALDSAGDAITLCITMTGVMAFWMGLMEIAAKAGVIESLSKTLEPFINWLFPRLKEEYVAKEYIATNMVANFLGLGWAATPAGLKAMEELAKLLPPTKNNIRYASDEMCTFLVINISSLQLIPINIIAYRTQYGSVNPTGIVGSAIIATTASTIAGILFCKCMTRRNK